MSMITDEKSYLYGILYGIIKKKQYKNRGWKVIKSKGSRDITDLRCYRNPQLLKFILKNKQKIKEILKDNKDDTNQMFNILSIIYKMNIEGFYEAKYFTTVCDREYVQKKIKQILSYNLYYDLDICNAH